MIKCLQTGEICIHHLNRPILCRCKGGNFHEICFNVPTLGVFMHDLSHKLYIIVDFSSWADIDWDPLYTRGPEAKHWTHMKEMYILWYFVDLMCNLYTSHISSSSTISRLRFLRKTKVHGIPFCLSRHGNTSLTHLPATDVCNCSTTNGLSSLTIRIRSVYQHIIIRS